LDIYFVRHGQTRGDRILNIDGYPDAGLTETGLKQAHLTGEKLSKIQFNAIYSSDLKRAVRTAEIISSYQPGLSLEVDKRVREIHMGAFFTSSEDQISVDYPEFYSDFLKKDKDFRYPGGESGQDVLMRSLNFLESIKDKEFENVCIVSHGGVIRSVFSHILGLPQHRRFSLHPINCGVSVLRYDKENNNFKIIAINEFLHLYTYVTF
jgi:broad specificity phosphatase PhoE